MTLALTFPGQGSQAVGMGKNFYDQFPVARQTFEEVDAALGQKLSQIIFEGPEETLTLTANAQPAIMATSMAIFRVLEQETGLKLAKNIQCVAGHSLGEYSALCAAGALSLADTARLLRLRGDAMQRAVPLGEGGMAAILGLEIDAVRELANRAAGSDVCAIANDNSPGQVVISGDKKAIERAVGMAKEYGAKKAVLLAVSAPFHCSLMISAAEAMREALAKVTIHDPVVPLIANVTAEEVQHAEAVRSLLVAQVTGMVRWRESVSVMKESGVTTLIEVGVGRVLTGLAKRIERELHAIAVEKPEDIAAFTTLLESIHV
jgi:[acyl-carrier-protein] S-malonyltransferase